MKKQKYLQIFNYLLEFSKLRSKSVRDIEASESQYPEIVWFADIPEHNLFDCITNQNFNQDADYWIKVHKPKEPIPPLFPKIDDVIEPWIIKESLSDENGIPLLKSSIIKDGKTTSLSEYPQIEKEFENYLNNKWIDDLEFYKTNYSKYKNELFEFEKLNEIYKRLFSISNKAQQFGEEYEFIIGVGLLSFKENDNTPLIRRHILTSKAEIVFESPHRDSFVKVSPSFGNDIQIETDAIIDLFEQFESTNIIEAEEKTSEFLKEKNIADNPFDELIKDAIQIFADRLRSDGQFKDVLEQPKEISKKPTIYFSPALLLRKRNTRSLTTLYEKIIKNISNADETINIPQINDIIGHLQETNNSTDGLVNSSSNIYIDETIYFPKKYNDEQIEIIQKTRKNNKVLVQGPPGTGKSHTIANLICHLLANGKKVLVTAYTKRALEVLHNQFTEEEELKEFKNLIVNLLSSDSSSIQSLEASVNAINDELSRVNLNDLTKDIGQLEARLSSIKENKATTKNKWLAVREKSTRKQSVNSIYQGTLMEIAEQIEKDLPIFDWFKDKFADINRLEIITDIEKFISLSNDYQNIDCTTFNHIIPLKENIISVNELKEYLYIKKLFQKYAPGKSHILIDCEDFQKLKEQLEILHRLYVSIEGDDLPLKTKIINDYQTNFVYYKNILLRTDSLLQKLPDEKLKEFDRNIEITYPENKSLIQLKNDAQTLRFYVKEKNKLSGIIFNLKKAILPKTIKEKLYFIEEVNVNGSSCDTESEFETVLADINIKQDFKELENLWQVKYEENTKSYFDKAKFFKQLKVDTESLINKITETNKVKEQVESLSSIKIQIYDSEKVGELIDETEYNFILARIKIFEEKIAETNKYLSIQNTHPVASLLIKAIEDLDPDKYEQHLTKIDNLIIEKEKYSNYKKLQKNLQQNLPILIDEILKGTFNFSNIQQIEKAICFKHAFAEITKLMESDYETNLAHKLDEFDDHEVRLISEIASKKAWINVLKKLNDNRSMRQHLQAWVQAMKKIGKRGTGKRALKFRKEAQYQMEQCKDSVPCWIMPMYKVAETINPEQGLYDYVIIDEASQLGPDAIFLLYISKNIIIVGDDKQTSPEYVGVDANTMAPFINKFLQDIPFANFFGTEFSFFEHAER